jgi:toxin secretion/phage lysis holin
LNIAPLIVVLIFIAFDVLTGWLKAFATGTTNSSIMREGLVHKIGELLAMAFGYVCQYTLPYVGVEVKIPFAGAIGTYIVLMEIASVVENISVMNPELAKVLEKVFSKEKINGEEGVAHLEREENESADSR